MKKLKRIITVTAISIAALTFTGCTASTARACKSCQSNVSGGLERTINIYTVTGELIATYNGKIDIDDNTNGSIMFDIDGKRYVYYNAIIEVIEN